MCSLSHSPTLLTTLRFALSLAYDEPIIYIVIAPSILSFTHLHWQALELWQLHWAPTFSSHFNIFIIVNGAHNYYYHGPK